MRTFSTVSYFLTIPLLFAFSFSTQAQKGATLAIRSVGTSSNPAVVVSFSLAKYADTLATLQFSLNWDTTLLAFKEISGFGLPSSSESIGLNNVGKGQLSFAWFEPNAIGIRLTDSVIIYKVNFTPKQTGKHSLQITNTPTKIEATDYELKKYNVSTIPNQVQSEVKTATQGAVEEKINFRLIPTTFQHQSALQFTLPIALQLRLQVVDAQGKVASSEVKDYSAGDHQYLFGQTLTHGYYYLNIHGIVGINPNQPRFLTKTLPFFKL